MGGFTEGMKTVGKLFAHSSVKAMEKVTPRLASRLGGSGCHMGESTLLKYVKESSQASRFKIVGESSKGRVNKEAAKVFETGTGHALSKTKRLMLYDVETARTVNLKQAAKMVYPDKAMRKSRMMIERLEGIDKERFITGRTISQYGHFTNAVWDNSLKRHVPLRQYFPTTRSTFNELQQSLRSAFGDSPIGKMLSSFFERIFRVPRFVSPAPKYGLTAGRETAERATTEAVEAAGRETAERATTEAVEAAGRETAERATTEAVEAAGKESAERATTEAVEAAGRETAERATTEAVEAAGKESAEHATTEAVEAAGKESAERATTEAVEAAGRESAERATTEAVEAAGRESAERAMTEAVETAGRESAERATTEAEKAAKKATARWTEWLKLHGALGEGSSSRFVENALDSSFAKSAKERGKTIYDTVSKRFITPKQAAKQVYAKEAAERATAEAAAEKAVEKTAVKPKTAEEIAAEVRRAATTNKNYPVSERLFDKMNAGQQSRLRAIQGREAGFEEQRKAIDEMRKAANGIKSERPQDIAERTRLLSDAAEKEAKLSEAVTSNKMDFANLVKEADKSTLRKVVEWSLAHPKLAGWGGLGAGYLLYHSATGKGAFGLANEVLSDKVPKRDENGNVMYDNDGNVIYEKSGVVSSAVDVAFGQGTSDQAADFVKGKVAPSVVNGAHYVINGVDYVLDEAKNVWENGKMVAAAGSRDAGRFIDYVSDQFPDGKPQYSTSPSPHYTYSSDVNGWVDNGTGSYHDPSSEPYPQTFVGNNGQGIPGQVMTTLNNATNYVSGQNVSKTDLGKLIAASLLTFGRFGWVGKAGGLLLGGSAAHDINVRGQQQPVSQQQQQQYVSQLYNQQSEQEGEVIHRGV